MRRDMVAPLWEGVSTLVPDDVTKASSGQIVVTAFLIHAIKLLRADVDPSNSRSSTARDDRGREGAYLQRGAIAFATPRVREESKGLRQPSTPLPRCRRPAGGLAASWPAGGDPSRSDA